MHQSSSGEVKSMIEYGSILVNGLIETQKRKKIVVSDIMKVSSVEYKIILA
ncbi:RNA-binding S4 domain-containing protein [uncultured Tolumonas sp.]|uniref:RNA-binding S4 domain-containing protein n=1 Tax=uncultured Tolumonas sp. TaxID=263765 RepID=UPI002ABD9094|nr:RNA-binding S4 domain-containing protein [uncultured Tolumonas sp.]